MNPETSNMVTINALPAVAQLGATRSSHRWADLPGNFDRLNLTRAVFATDNPYGIPTLPAATFEPAQLVPYNNRAACTAASRGNSGAAVHFFLDDYRFETLWSKPVRAISRTCSVGAALSPDFSLWSNMPPVMQMWQVYRSRWCGAWMLHHGISVIPTISWSTPDSYPYAFTGIPTGSIVAVSTIGTHRNPTARDLFATGYQEMLTRLQPKLVLIYGREPAQSVLTDTPVRCYPTRWEHR